MMAELHASSSPVNEKGPSQHRCAQPGSVPGSSHGVRCHPKTSPDEPEVGWKLEIRPELSAILPLPEWIVTIENVYGRVARDVGAITGRGSKTDLSFHVDSLTRMFGCCFRAQYSHQLS